MTDMFNINRKSSGSRKPKERRFGFLRNVVWIGVGIVIALFLIADPLKINPFHDWLYRLHGENPETGASASAQSGERKILFYRNPMNPTITSPRPMKDEMGMDYVPVYADDASQGSGKASGERKILFYRNPMNPTITSPKPMKDEMGMDYVPVYADEANDAADGSTVKIDPATVQNMNVQVQTVALRDVTHQVRTVGTLDYDPQNVVTVTTKYSGYIEKVYVNYIGENVRRGQALFEIYSPELVQTQQELLSAVSFAKRMANASDDARGQANALVEAARTRLGYWDISPRQIARIEKSGTPIRTLTVVSPTTGMVIQRMEGMEGMAAKAGMQLFQIANLSSLWVSVQAFENQLPWLRAGSEATMQLQAFPGETFHGKVRYIEPQVSEKTRTLNLRIEVPNRDGKLRPGMYATVTFAPVAAKNAITVPTLAVLRTGERNVVIVADGNGRFTPREVKLGAEGDGYVQVLSGLQAGETVVTSSQFLIDSESNLQEAIQKMVATKSNGGGHAE
ncbi:MAG: efflux RND transporter periplasmic adaptor subunit [Thermoanaerobaculia bacterium]